MPTGWPRNTQVESDFRSTGEGANRERPSCLPACKRREDEVVQCIQNDGFLFEKRGASKGVDFILCMHVDSHVNAIA